MIGPFLARHDLEWSLLVPLALVAGFGIALVALSFVVMLRARSLVRRSERQTEEAERQWKELFEDCRKELAASQEALNRKAADQTMQSSPRPGINLSRRSQALRMHRKGEAPEQIATALQIPQQEVELLVKVHRIVLDSI